MTRVLKNKNDVLVWFEDIVEDHENKVLKRVNEAVKDTAQYMRYHIASTPSSIVPGKPDRIDTGLMWQSVDFEEVVEVGDKHWVASVGWTDRQEDYFITQEYGGYSAGLRRGDKNISPMHMLVGGYTVLLNQLSGGL